jgi:hypothetical protein
METYKIKHPPIGSADGVYWENISLSEKDAAPLIAAGIISKKNPAATESEETKPPAKLPKK